MTESAEKKPSRPPEYQVSCLNKRTEERGPVGAAWRNQDGSISVKLNAFVVLPSPQDMVLTLFPNTPKTPYKKKAADEHVPEAAPGGNPPEETPF